MEEAWLQTNEQAVKEIEADWIIFQDADEFLLPKSGYLKAYLAQAECDVLSVPRYNVPLSQTGPMLPTELVSENYGEVQLIVKSFPDIRQQLRDDPETPWIRAVPPPKVIVRPEALGHLTEGMHDIVPASNRNVRRETSDALVFAHVPLSTQERFMRKLKGIRECFGPDEVVEFDKEDLGPAKAWHWRRWLNLAEKGELDREFERSVFSDAFIEQLRSEGYVCSASDFFRGKQGSA